MHYGNHIVKRLFSHKVVSYKDISKSFRNCVSNIHTNVCQSYGLVAQWKSRLSYSIHVRTTADSNSKRGLIYFVFIIAPDSVTTCNWDYN